MFEHEFVQDASAMTGITYDETPATQGQVWDASLNLQREVNSRYALPNKMKELYAKRSDELYSKLESEGVLDLPDKAFMQYPARNIEIFTKAYGGDEQAFNSIMATGRKQSYENFAWLQDQLKNRNNEFKTDEQLEAEAYAFMRSSKEKNEAVLGRNTDHFFTQLGGGMAAEAYNPDFYVSMLVGGQWKQGASIVSNMLRVGATESLVAAGFEAATQTDVLENLEKAGIDYSWQEAATNIGLASAGGFIFGASIAGGVQTGGQLLKKLRGDKDILDQKVAQSLTENKQEIRELSEMADEVSTIVERVVDEYGDDVPVEQVQQEIASYLARKRQFDDYVANGDDALSMATREYVEELLPIAGDLMTKAERKALDDEIKIMQAKTGDEASAKLKALKATKARQAEAEQARNTINKIQDGEITEPLAQRVYEIREQRANQNAELGPINDDRTPVTVRQPLAKAQQMAGEAVNGIDDPKVPSKAVEHDIFTEVLDETAKDTDVIMMQRLNDLLVKQDVQVPVGSKVDDDGVVSAETVSAKALLDGLEKEGDGLNDILMCVRGANA